MTATIYELEPIPSEDVEGDPYSPAPLRLVMPMRKYTVEVRKGEYTTSYECGAVDMDCAITVARRMYNVDHGFIGDAEKFTVWEVG